MSRLRREIKPYLAALRMSQVDLVIFVEGNDFDPVFYGSITKRLRAETGWSIQLRRAAELPTNADRDKGGSGGSRPLLKAADFWARRKQVYLSIWGRKKTIKFCIDKDVADVVGLPPYNSGVVRTPFHSVENHLYHSVDIVQACEVALSLAPGELVELGQSSTDWLRWASELWSDWVIHCILTLRLAAPGIASFSVPSQFNKPAGSSAKPSLQLLFRSKLQQSLGLDEPSFGGDRRSE